MRDNISNELKEIEQLETVKILYACESGSRAWGFPSADSDYDVRFLYIHPTDWYISIFDRPDVIERPINDLLDVSGWDLRKALQLLRKSNPSLLEWLQSPIIYDERYPIAQRLRDLAHDSFSPKACMYHYLSMAKSTERLYLKGEQVKIKKYFYVLRPILAAQWIDRYLTMPPMSFDQLVQELVPKGEMFGEIEMLVARKKAGEELDLESKIDCVHNFIGVQFEQLEKRAKEIKPTVINIDGELDDLFRETLRTW
ncbi:putative nucleotidyltransferase [Filibacter limicola]|uniref:Nucleotidyltransferase n=2 Tax=Sporosarcina limicola TaxID=34101 RepID=A0A927MJK4_9BACL|nr:putative nucleotidyltransferase [Sporosarcina limicola]